MWRHAHLQDALCGAVIPQRFVAHLLQRGKLVRSSHWRGQRINGCLHLEEELDVGVREDCWQARGGLVGRLGCGRGRQDELLYPVEWAKCSLRSRQLLQCQLSLARVQCRRYGDLSILITSGQRAVCGVGMLCSRQEEQQTCT